MKYFSLHQQWVLFVLALLLLGILYFKFYDHPLPPEEKFKEIVVEVLGEVQKPGIYIFRNPPTLGEAIERAGGLKEPAQLDSNSSTEILETGALLTVMKDSSQIFPPSSSNQKKFLSPSFPQGGMKQDEIRIKILRMEANKLLVFNIPLDLNQASLEDLCLIPGIGESLAREIVTYREKRNGFRSIEELKNVKGISEKKSQSLKTFLTVRN